MPKRRLINTSIKRHFNYNFSFSIKDATQSLHYYAQWNTEESPQRWFFSIALLISTAHDFLVISARKWARAKEISSSWAGQWNQRAFSLTVRCLFYCIKLVYNPLLFSEWLRKKILTWGKKLLPKMFITFSFLWSKMYIFAKKHISNCYFKTLQCIYWDFLILTPCFWSLKTGNVAAFRKRKTHLVGTIARIFDAHFTSYES